MATASHRLRLVLLTVIGLLAIGVNARPGLFHPRKTLILLSAVASSYPLDQSPSFPLEDPSAAAAFSDRRSVTFLITEVRELDPNPSIFFDPAATTVDEEKRPLPFGFYSSVDSSFRDRTKEFLTVVASLLFGVGCGALTAATLYLMWSLFAPNRFDFRDSDDEFDDDDDDDDYDSSPKKMGYVAIQAADAPVAATPTKEVV